MSRRLAFRPLLGAASLVVLGACATSGVRTADTIDLGRGPQGEICRAERAWGDAAAPGLFDQSFALQCLGWTDTRSAGQLYAAEGADAEARIDARRSDRLSCGAAVAATLPGLGAGRIRRCIDREGGFDAFAATVAVGGRTYAADGLRRFEGNIMAGLRMLAGAGAGSARPLDLSVAPPAPPSATTGAGYAVEAALGARRTEVLDYSIRGKHGEAREIVTRYLAQLPAAAQPVDRVEFLLEAALSESNLGYAEVAGAYLDEAETLLATMAPGPTRARLITKRRIYAAIDALNRRDFAAAVRGANAALADAAAASPVQVAALSDAPLRDPDLLRQLNRPTGTRTLVSRDTAAYGEALLRAQAFYVRAVGLAAQDDAVEATVALAQAAALLTRFDDSGLETSNVQWLRSAVASERGRLAQRAGDMAGARAGFAEAVMRLERSSIYADTPLLAQRQIDYAAFLASAGEPDAALAEYDKAAEVLKAGGPSTAGSVTGLAGYLALLAARAGGTGTAADAARSRFFEVSQFVNPPAVAAQIAQIQKVFESGSSDAAVRAKTLQDLDREGRALSTRIAALPAGAADDRARLQSDLAAVEQRISTVRQELAGNEQYQQARDSIASLAELQAALRAGEVYFKLLTLPGTSYGVLVTATSVDVYPVGLPTADLEALVRQVRRSIDGNLSADGRVVPLVFDVAAAARLYDALFAPVAAKVGAATMLVTEPSGSLTQLPLGVLVTSDASAAAFAESVKRNSRDYTKVAFLARAVDVSTTVSPRAFLVARAQSASRARQPYIGFGTHVPPAGDTLAALPQRGALAGRCGARADLLRAAFASLKPIGRAELDTAERVLGGGQVVTGAAFTDEALDARRDFRDYAVVHFATHGLREGELDCDSPPALVTSVGPDAVSDGLLSFEEIANLQLDANLVVLSACNTAAETSAARAGAGAGFRTGRAGQGATLNGLVRAFLVAGSRAVLTTHWAIPDGFRTRDGRQVAASTTLIETMFRNAATETISDSLRTAQTRMIEAVDTSHPYYWGAFAVVGDGSKSMLGRSS